MTQARSEDESQSNPYPKAVGGYIFAGGFTLGMQAAGFDVRCHLEDAGYGVKTARLNFPDLPIYVGSEQWPIDELADEGVDIVFGNPPCAAWSGLNGKKTSTGTWKHDGRIHCTLKHFTLLEQLRPKIWVWESVERAWSTGREFVEDLVDRAVELGYSVDLVLFDLQYVGGRHRRRRFFFVATQVDVDWQGEELRDPPSIGEVLDLVREPGPGVSLRPDLQEIWERTNFNQNLAHAWEAIYPPETRTYRETSTGTRYCRGRPSFRYRKMDPERVAPTMVGDSLLHPYRPRPLTLNEAKVVGGYPEEFKLESQSSGAYDLLTRAVMPPAGAWLGRRVRAGLDADERLPDPRVRLVDLRNPDDQKIVELTRQQDWVGDGAPRWLEPEPVKPYKSRSATGSQGRRRRTVDPDDVEVPPEAPTPAETGDTKSGAYIRTLLRGNQDGRWKLADEQIVRLVLEHFEGRKTSVADVAKQRADLRKVGDHAQRIFYDEVGEVETSATA